MPPVPAVAAGMTYLTIECAVKAYVSRTKRDQGDIMKSLIGVLALALVPTLAAAAESRIGRSRPRRRCSLLPASTQTE
jgi:hypothetical protein